jgi:hypothetical protein
MGVSRLPHWKIIPGYFRARTQVQKKLTPLLLPEHPSLKPSGSLGTRLKTNVEAGPEYSWTNTQAIKILEKTALSVQTKLLTAIFLKIF